MKFINKIKSFLLELFTPSDVDSKNREAHYKLVTNVAHICLGAALGVILGDLGVSYLITMAIVCVAYLTKEFFDIRYGGKVLDSKEDALSTLVGASMYNWTYLPVIALVVSFILSYRYIEE